MKVYVTDNTKTAEALACLFKAEYNPAHNCFSTKDTLIYYIKANYELKINSIGRNIIKFNDGMEDIVVTVDYKDYNETNTFKKILERTNVDVINICDGNASGQLNFEIFMLCSGVDSSISKRIWLHDSKIEQETITNTNKNISYKSESNAKLTESILEKYWHYRSKNLFNKQTEINLNELFLLNLIYNKEQEIKEQEIINTSEQNDYFKIDIEIKGYKFKWIGKHKKDKINSMDEALQIANTIKEKTVIINNINLNEGEKPYPLLFNSTDLYKEIQKHKIAPLSEAKNSIEKLYNKGYITNPATDSRHLPKSIADKLPNILSELKNSPPYKNYIDYIKINKKIKMTKRVINDDYVDINHAIIPTDNAPLNYTLTQSEFDIYDLIVRRFLAIFMGSTETLTVSLNGYIDNSNSIKYEKEYIKNAGWQLIYDPNTDMYREIEKAKNDKEDFMVPESNDFEFGIECPIDKVSIEAGNPRGKSRYTISGLINLMANCGRNIKSDNIKVKLRHLSIGMPEDRSAIVSKLIKKQYITIDEENKIRITEIGNDIIENAPKDLLTLQLLETFNSKIKAIQQTNETVHDVIREHTSYITKLLENKNDSNRYKFIDYESIINKYSCRFCEGKLIDKGKFIGCGNYPNCKFTIPKEMYQYNLKEQDITQLIKNGITNWITGFTFKKGPIRGGKARLKVNENRKVTLYFKD